MLQYIENEDGSLSFEGMTIPNDPSNRHYREALSLVESGEATIDHWAGSAREAEYLAAKEASDWKASRAAAVDAITVEIDGLIFDGDEVSQTRMARAVAAADSDEESTIWVLANNTPSQVTAGQLKRALKAAGIAQTNLWVKP